MLNLVSFLLFFFWSWIDRQADRRRCWQSRGGEISSRVAAGREKGVAVNRRRSVAFEFSEKKKKEGTRGRRMELVGVHALRPTSHIYIHMCTYSVSHFSLVRY